MIFREIAFGSDDFAKELLLRDDVLRAPLGLSLSDEDVERERDQLHFGLFAGDGEMLACVIAAPLSPTEAKIRQMAVGTDHQRSGHGSEIIQSLENELARRGFFHLWLHARLPAVGFYQKLGYRKVGEEFTEVGITHLRMEKDLSRD